MRVIFFENRTVRCGAVRFSLSKVIQCSTVRWGAVFILSKSYGAVRCGLDYFFQEPYGAVRCGAVIRWTVASYGAVERAP